MFERYTERARRVLFFARYEASQLGSLSIDTEHLLLGLLREGKGLTSRLFSMARLSPHSLRKEIERHTTFRTKTSVSQEIPFTPEAKRALEAAATEADRLLHGYIGTEHLLLGLLSDDTTVAGRLLTAHGLRLGDVRDQIVQLLSGHGPASEQPGRPVDERRDTRLNLARLLNVPPHLMEAPAQLDIPLVITRELRNVDTYVMSRVGDRVPQKSTEGEVGVGGIAVSIVADAALSPEPPSAEAVHSIGSLSVSATTMNELAQMLEHVLETPVIDETGLDGRYDIDLPGPHGSVEVFLAALKERAGLALTREKRDVEMVVVRRG
jgi:ATP-dependent Clp protease ATP-binding subunit ClpC